jgi:FtsH-binding integral membrane protein
LHARADRSQAALFARWWLSALGKFLMLAAVLLAVAFAIGVFVVPPETWWRPTRVKVRRR